jgi:hypothetical protein
LSTSVNAARYRAIAAVPGAWMHGSAGFNAATGEMLHEPGQVHFGAELTTIGNTQFGTDWARLAIAAITLDMMLLNGIVPPEAPVGQSDEADALRWDALMGLPRIRVMGYRGSIDEARTVIEPLEAGTMWFRAEFWSKPTTGPDPQTEPTLGRLCLTALADDIIASRAADGG